MPTRAATATVTVLVDPDPVARLGEQAARGGTEGLEALAQLVQLARSATSGTLDAQLLVPPLLALRDRARRDGLYAVADELRDLLIGADVEIRDEPGGTTWAARPT